MRLGSAFPYTYVLSHISQDNDIRGKVHPQAFLVGQHILIEEQVVVEPGAYIEGPCIIGRATILFTA